MKRLIISCILILALTSQAYAMGGWFGGKGGGGGSSERGSSSGTTNTTNNGTTNNGTTGVIIGGTDRQQCVVSAPELTTMFLLGSALFGLWGLRRKIKK
jgi:hypothetical protein